jgi:hypothetical protein
MFRTSSRRLVPWWALLAGLFLVASTISPGKSGAWGAWGGFAVQSSLPLSANQSEAHDFTDQTAASGCSTPQFGGNLKNFNAGNGPRSLVTADFNQDGKKDIAVANYGGGQGQTNGSISILLNTGSGFSAPQNVATGTNPRSIVAADFNKDTKIDLAVLTYSSCCIATVGTVFLGDGAGNFTVAAGGSFAVGNDAAALAAGDFNKDGSPDLAATVLNPFGTVAVFLGNGSGGFGAVTNYLAGANATSIVVGDLNGDSKPDLATGNLNSRNVSVFLGNGSGAFAPAINYDVGAFPQSIVVGDLNQDSKQDVVVASTGSVALILPGNGDGSLGSPISVNVGQSFRSASVADLNGDGRLDIVTANTVDNISVLLNSGSGNFAPAINYIVGPAPFLITSDDFNGDLVPDLATANFSSNNVSVLTGDGVGGFGPGRSYSVGSLPRSVAAGDFNNDGKVDLVVPNNGQSSVSVLLGNGGGTFGTDTKYSTAFGPADITVADFNGDGKLDLAIASSSPTTQSVSILLGNGNGGFGSPVDFTAGSGAYAIVSADFNRDGKVDLATISNADSNVSILIGDGNGAFAIPVNFSLPSFPDDLAIGDFDGDGNTDLAVAAGTISILLGSGTGSFSIQPPIMTSATAIAVGDVNGDGKADLGAISSADNLFVLLGDGTGAFGAANSFPIISPRNLTLADLNGDSKVDVAVTAGANVAILLGDGTGIFGAANLFSAGNPGAILDIDLNGDGRRDLVTVGSNRVSVLIDSCQTTPLLPPSMTIGDVTLPEGNAGVTNASFTVTLSSASTQTTTVSYYTSAQSAASGVDYQPVAGHLTFAPGSTSQTINVPVVGDTVAEPDEIFSVFLTNPLNAVVARTRATGTILNDEITVGFSSSSYVISEGANTVTVTVQRSGNTAGSATVDYLTSDTAGANNCNVTNNVASSRCDYLTTLGTLRFAAGETSKTISIPIVDDVYAEGSEGFTIALANPSGATLGSPATATITITDNDSSTGTNPIDTASFFVRQHYIDFLNREPDAGGLAFWTDQITSCGADAPCVEVKRINVSAAFYLSIEFQDTGYLVERLYKVSYGDAFGISTLGGMHTIAVPIVRLNEFLSDTQQIGQGVIVGQPGWEQALENNKQAFATEFVQRSRFTSTYQTSISPTTFVNALFTNAGFTPSTGERQAAINEFGAATTIADAAARARAARRVAESPTLNTLESNRAFVLMQFFGYLRRNPNDPQDTDYTGYDFWLGKLNQFNGNFVNAEMVKAFITSSEYRQRFGP